MSSDCSARMPPTDILMLSFVAAWVMWSVSSVSTAPGSTTTTRTPRAVTSCRSDSENAFTAHLLAL